MTSDVLEPILDRRIEAPPAVDAESPVAMAPARIVLYGMNYAPELLGVGRFSGELGAYLARLGCGVTAITSPPHYPSWSTSLPHRAGRYGRETIGGVEVVRCPIWLRKGMRGLSRLLAPASFALSSLPVAFWQIGRHRPDVVLVVEPTLLVAPAALVAATLFGAKTVLHVQDLEVDAAFAVGHLRGAGWLNLMRRVERFLISRFDAVVTISHQMQRKLEEKGVEPRRLSLVRNWVDLEKIRPTDGPNPFRNELGVPETTLVALYAGSVGAKQGLDVMLDAAARLAAETGILFVIAGDGPAKDGLAARYGHLRNVRFLPMQPEDRLGALMNFADLHVLPQSCGAADLVLPSKLGGMLASGRNLLVTADDNTELHDFLNGAAVLVPSGDSEAMAREIARLARDRPAPPTQRLRDLAGEFDAKRSLPRFAALLGALVRS
jgi:colanic acid biosynthesis glycosyl transferase WcaI